MRRRREEFDTTAHLTKGEKDTLRRAVDRIFKSIVRRERDPVRRRLIMFRLGKEVDYMLALASSRYQAWKVERR